MSGLELHQQVLELEALDGVATVIEDNIALVEEMKQVRQMYRVEERQLPAEYVAKLAHDAVRHQEGHRSMEVPMLQSLQGKMLLL